MPSRILPQGGGGLLSGRGAWGAAAGKLPAAPAGPGGDAGPSAGRKQVVRSFLTGFGCCTPQRLVKKVTGPMERFGRRVASISITVTHPPESPVKTLGNVYAGAMSAGLSWRSSSLMTPPTSTGTCHWVGWDPQKPSPHVFPLYSAHRISHCLQLATVLCPAAKSCKRDIKRRCKDVKGGHGELTACLRCSYKAQNCRKWCTAFAPMSLHCKSTRPAC
jgi:Cysteine rich repeat